MSQSANPEIIIFGATHVGITLARRLTKQSARVLVVDRFADAPETPSGWEYASSDFALPVNIHEAQVVYAVTDEDKLNIRIALAVRTASRAVPVVITLVQSRLGKKLARQLERFSYVSPSELAAREFVEAIYAPKPKQLVDAPALIAEPEVAQTAVSRIDPLVVRALSVVCIMAGLATTYFHYAEQLSWIDSLYFVVTLMATVGFGDISLRSSTTLSKIIGILLMVASVTNTAVIFALITDSLVRHRLALSFGQKQVKLTGHVLVVGIGSVGFNVVEELKKRGEVVVVIDERSGGRYMPAVYAKRIPTVIGDAKQERVLRDAGLPRAKALLSVTNDDLTNLEIGLNAKLLNPELRVVLRIYDQVLAQSLDERLDIHFAFSMSSIAAGVLGQFAEKPLIEN